MPRHLLHVADGARGASMFGRWMAGNGGKNKKHQCSADGGGRYQVLDIALDPLPT